MAKYCIECQGQKPMRENGIKITSYNRIEAKKNRKMGWWGKWDCYKYEKSIQESGYIWSKSRRLINLFHIYSTWYLIFSLHRNTRMTALSLFTWKCGIGHKISHFDPIKNPIWSYRLGHIGKKGSSFWKSIFRVSMLSRRFILERK